MRTVGEESLEMFLCLGDGIRPRHADDAKALRMGLREKSGLDRAAV